MKTTVESWKWNLRLSLKKLKETNQNQVTCTKLRFFGTGFMEFAGSYFEFGRVSKDKWKMLQRWAKAKPRAPARGRKSEKPGEKEMSRAGDE